MNTRLFFLELMEFGNANHYTTDHLKLFLIKSRYLQSPTIKEIIMCMKLEETTNEKYGRCINYDSTHICKKKNGVIKRF